MILKSHPEADLIRYMDGELQGSKRTEIEQHVASCERCRGELSFARDFNGSLAELKPEERAVEGACPDSWTLVSYEAGEVDEETARQLRVHLLSCEECRDEFYALRRARPKRVEVNLRVFRKIIEALHVPGATQAFLVPAGLPVTRTLRQAFAAPFQVSETLTDPDSGEKYSVTLRVENAIRLPEERVRVVVECDPVPDGWRTHLFDAEHSELANVPMSQPQIELSAELAHGFYVLEVARDEESVGEFVFTVEPFSLPEAVEAALEHFGLRDYSRALAILEGAIERSPERQDLWDLQSLVLAAAASDVEEVETEEERAEGTTEHGEVGRVRSLPDLVREAWGVIREAKSRFGESLASKVAAAVLDPAALPGETSATLPAQTQSLPVLRAVEILTERLAASERKMAQLAPLLDDVHSRLQRFSQSFESLQNSAEAIRRETGRNADDKFAALGQLLERFTESAARHGTSFPDYEPFFQSNFGKACWSWLGPEVQKIFIWAEVVYRYIGSQPAIHTPDFSPALLQLCKGFEVVINNTLRGVCGRIASTVKSNPQLLGPAELPEKSFDVKKTISLTQAANILVAGKVIQRKRPGAFGAALEPLLAASPGLTDFEFLMPLMQIGMEFRNGKTHGDEVTSPHEMQILRKLVWGVDEYRVSSREFLFGVEDARWWRFSKAERTAAVDQLAAIWGTYPGLISMLWKAFQQPST